MQDLRPFHRVSTKEVRIQLTEDKFESWAILEIMGHDRYAGLVTEQAIGGCAFVRVDVPAIDDLPEFCKLFGSSAIFSITPVTKEVAIEAIKRFRAKPIVAAGFPQQRLPYYEDEDQFEELT